MKNHRNHHKSIRHHRLNQPFRCLHCGASIELNGAGSAHRNHCPHCLHSRHVDVSPGDRASDCQAVMEPISVWVRSGGEWAIIHRCTGCGELSSNRVAGDDDIMRLLSIAARPMAEPLIPWEALDRHSS
ncbi:MAG: RNHCP domain-containing protein [Armatimonadetes bacterium]|nr:RNHCP domain-containing protein [Armatimonadota bacterium]